MSMKMYYVCMSSEKLGPNPESELDWLNISQVQIEKLIGDEVYDIAAALIKTRFTGVYRMLRNDFEALQVDPEKDISDEDWSVQHRGLVQECAELIQQLRDVRLWSQVSENDQERLEAQIKEFEDWMSR